MNHFLGRAVDNSHIIEVGNANHTVASFENSDIMVISPNYFEQKHIYTDRGQRMEQNTDKDALSTGGGAVIRKLYVHEDIMGNTRYHTKDNGQSYAELEYDVWGNPTSPNKLLNNDNGTFVFAQFTGHIYDTVLDAYFAESRFYDAKNRQWLSSDPMKDGLNWYQYVRANPVTFFDPSGLESYILYDANDGNEAKVEVMRLELEAYFGKPCYTIPISSGTEFINVWNGTNSNGHKGLGYDDKGNKVSSIDATIVLAHGRSDGFVFKTASGGWNADSVELGKGHIANFNDQKMDYFVLFSCNVADSSIGNSVANEFYNLQKANIGKIIAADGGVVVDYTQTTSTSGWWIFEKTTVTHTFEIHAGGKDGFKIYSDNGKSTTDIIGNNSYSSISKFLDKVNEY